MGIDYHLARCLLEARREGGSFTRTLTIAHQRLNLHPREVRALRRDVEMVDQGARALPGYRFGEYSDRFFRSVLGVERLEVLDFSPYEGATLIHDLNRPIPEELHGTMDAVVDGGSLEHVFDFPTAAANIMRLLRPGGRLFLCVPANNLCGHGFYQFSPELMYRVFSDENGFAVSQVLFLEARYPGVELAPKRRAYRVVDPAEVHHRVQLVSKRPVMMLVEAQRVSEVEPFTVVPQQSDYKKLWEAEHSSARSLGQRTARPGAMVDRVPPRLLGALRGRRRRAVNDLRNSQHYKRL